MTITVKRIESSDWADVRRLREVRQGDIGISKANQTDFISLGFAGCTALTLAPVGGPGGMVAHISYTENSHLREVAQNVVDLAKEKLKKTAGGIYLVISNGRVKTPELAEQLKTANNELAEVDDIRDGGETGALLYCTESKVLYLWKAMDDKSQNACAAKMDPEPKPIEEGGMKFSYSDKSIPWAAFE